MGVILIVALVPLLFCLFLYAATIYYYFLCTRNKSAAAAFRNPGFVILFVLSLLSLTLVPSLVQLIGQVFA